MTERTLRVGQGFDVHRLVAGRELWLAGVKIPFEKGLLGHSDADAAAHAACDALLGAAGLGDIGQHFPDTDARWKGASGEKLAGETRRLLAAAGWRVLSLDINVVAQRPKILPHVPLMRANLARWFEAPPDAVSIKGRSAEEIGFVGRGEGIAALAVALIEKRL